MPTTEEMLKALERRHGYATIQSIIDNMNVCKSSDPEYLELKQMIDILGKYRSRARNTLHQYRTWKKFHSDQKDEIESVYSSYEGLFLKEQLNDAMRMYVLVNNDYHEMLKTYIQHLEEKGWASMKERRIAV